MRIGIDAHASERDGSGNCTYLRNLITHLIRIDKDNEYVLLATDPSHSFYQSIHGDNLRIRHITPSPTWFRAYVDVPLVSIQESIDVLHSQYFAPYLTGIKLVITVHDLTPFRYPEYFSPFERFLFHSLLPSSVRRASAVIAVSESSARDLVELLHAPQNKVVTVYNGLVPGNNNGKETSRVDGKFILYVGRIDPRKNLARLIEAFSICKKRHGLEHRLVIAGKPYLSPRILEAALDDSEFRKHIVLPGYVTDEELQALYSSADAFVYVSEYEGFGFPPLEAMLYGIPVVASDIPPFREVLQDAALLVNPLDVESIASAIHSVVTDTALRKNLVVRSKQLLPNYSWEQAAARTLEVYRLALHSK